MAHCRARGTAMRPEYRLSILFLSRTGVRLGHNELWTKANPRSRVQLACVELDAYWGTPYTTPGVHIVHVHPDLKYQVTHFHDQLNWIAARYYL